LLGTQVLLIALIIALNLDSMSLQSLSQPSPQWILSVWSWFGGVWLTALIGAIMWAALARTHFWSRPIWLDVPGQQRSFGRWLVAGALFLPALAMIPMNLSQLGAATSQWRLFRNWLSRYEHFLPKALVLVGVTVLVLLSIRVALSTLRRFDGSVDVRAQRHFLRAIPVLSVIAIVPLVLAALLGVVGWTGLPYWAVITLTNHWADLWMSAALVVALAVVSRERTLVALVIGNRLEPSSGSGERHRRTVDPAVASVAAISFGASALLIVNCLGEVLMEMSASLSERVAWILRWPMLAVFIVTAGAFVYLLILVQRRCRDTSSATWRWRTIRRELFATIIALVAFPLVVEAVRPLRLQAAAPLMVLTLALCGLANTLRQISQIVGLDRRSITGLGGNKWTPMFAGFALAFGLGSMFVARFYGVLGEQLNSRSIVVRMFDVAHIWLPVITCLLMGFALFAVGNECVASARTVDPALGSLDGLGPRVATVLTQDSNADSAIPSEDNVGSAGG